MSRVSARIFRATVWGALASLVMACGDTRSEGDCLTDFDCESDQLCGGAGHCLLCANCDRGRVGTCTAPAFPLDRDPDTIRLEDAGGGDLLVYVYQCPGATSEYRYLRSAGEACFDPEPNLSDGCGLN